MYLFTRVARLAPGHTRDSMQWAVGITERVNQITELDVSLWTSVLSPGLGTMSWSTMVEDLEQLEVAEAKLLVEDSYVAEVDRGATYASQQGVDDYVLQILHGGFDPNHKPHYVSVVQSALANGAFARGIEVGIEIATRAGEISGLPTAFALAMTGSYGAICWMTSAETLAQLQAGEAQVNSDPAFVELVDGQAKDCYLAGVTQQSILRRIV